MHAFIDKPKHLSKAIHDIYKTFVLPDSPLAINIDHDTRAEITKRIQDDDFSEHIFDKAQAHVYRLMEKDCFSRFLHTESYKELSKRLKLPQTICCSERNSPC